MKTSEQIVVRHGNGGPYRSLDLTGRERRKRLVTDIDFLKRVLSWKRYTRSTPFTLILLLLSYTGLVVFFCDASLPATLAALVVLLIVGWDTRYSLLLFFYWRRADDPTLLIRKKIDELAELPPE